MGEIGEFLKVQEERKNIGNYKPEKRLMAKLLLSALIDFTEPQATPGCRDAEVSEKQIFKSASLWLFEDLKTSDRFISFRDCCDYLDLNPFMIRAGARRILEANKKTRERAPIQSEQIPPGGNTLD